MIFDKQVCSDNADLSFLKAILALGGFIRPLYNFCHGEGVNINNESIIRHVDKQPHVVQVKSCRNQYIKGLWWGLTERQTHSREDILSQNTISLP